MLGQDQDSVGGGFQNDDSFQGMLSDVNVWNSVLPGTTIKEISRSCVLDEWNEANVYQWSDFLRQGGTQLLKPSPCKPFGKLDWLKARFRKFLEQWASSCIFMLCYRGDYKQNSSFRCLSTVKQINRTSRTKNGRAKNIRAFLRFLASRSTDTTPPPPPTPQ